MTDELQDKITLARGFAADPDAAEAAVVRDALVRNRCEVPGCGALLPANFHNVTIDISVPVRIRICDACRRKLCTCGRCSAYDQGTADEYAEHYGVCRAFAGFATVVSAARYLPAVAVGPRHCSSWCRDGFRQARPWTIDEARRWLGLCKHCDAELPEGAEDDDCKTCAREGMLTEEQRVELGFDDDCDSADADGARFTTEQANEHIASVGHWGIPRASDGDADDDVTTPVDDDGDSR